LGSLLGKPIYRSIKSCSGAMSRSAAICARKVVAGTAVMKWIILRAYSFSPFANFLRGSLRRNATFGQSLPQQVFERTGVDDGLRVAVMHAPVWRVVETNN
jgi:hypothetical protein